MKINPGNHLLRLTEQVTQSNIPLAYIKEASGTVNENIVIDDKFTRKCEERVYPFQSFDTNKVKLFEKSGETFSVVRSEEFLKFRNSKYVFTPKDSVEYIPSEFIYSVLIKKKDIYRNDTVYNISFKAYSDYNGFADGLVGAFSSENKHKPANIIFNDNSMSHYSLTTSNFDSGAPDFLVTSLADLEADENGYFTVDLDEKTNLWIIDESFGGALKELDGETVYKLNETMLYSSREHSLSNMPYYSFDDQALNDLFPDTSYYSYGLFEGACPIYIMHAPDERYYILSHPSILENIDESCKMVFETILLVYLNSYFRTAKRISRISDNVIDSFVQPTMSLQSYHPRINLTEMLYSDGYNNRITYEIAHVDAMLKESGDEAEIRYLNIDRFNNLLFKKMTGNDPMPGENDISVYTVNDTVINYDRYSNNIYLLEELPVIRYEKINERHIVIVEPFCSSSNNIANFRTVQISKDNMGEYIKANIEYSVYYEEAEDIFSVSAADISSDISKIRIGTIELVPDKELVCGDIRAYGGGEINYKDNYELIDHSSLKGRPYRVGSVMIIRLPSRFKYYKTILEQEIRKHMSSADYPILVFERGKNK